MLFRTATCTVIAATIALGTLGPARAGASSGRADIVDTAVQAGSFKTLAAALQAAGLVEALKGDGPFTVFAPTDEAFAQLPDGTLQRLLEPANRGQLGEILKYHVVAGRVSGAQAIAAGAAETLQGEQVRIALQDGRLTVNDATVVKNDIDCTNGVIHVIDRVILPPSSSGSAMPPAAKYIALAIERGVPLFNGGQPAACTAVYEVTARGLVDFGGDALSESDRSTLSAALEDIQETHDASRQAWILRRALDSVYASVMQR